MKCQVIGGGSFGLALARLLSLNGNETRIWCREEDDPDTLRDTRHSPYYLTGIRLPDEVEVVREVEASCDISVLAVPSHALRKVLSEHVPANDTLFVSVAKGIENDTLMRMSEVVRDVLGKARVAVLSGPSHAEEVGRDLPTTVTVASDDPEDREAVQEAFMRDTFRVYTSPDVAGLELGGSLKNVIAIAAGASDGLGLGDNAKAALMTRGLAEIARLGEVLGADPLTFAGLSGMGDLIVTCTSRHSRNRALGERIGRGERLDEITAGSRMVAEGVRTTRSAVALSERWGIELPICREVYRVLFEGATPGAAIANLMEREAKPERH